MSQPPVSITPAPLPTPQSPLARITTWTLCLTAFTALLAWSYQSAKPTFLRAESGEYLVVAASDPQTIKWFLTERLKHPIAGHYTPLAFATELLFAKAFGPTGHLWHARQVFLLAILATALLRLAITFTRTCVADAKSRWLISITFALLIVMQPYFADFVSWPYMGIQFVWMILTVLAATSLLRTAARDSITLSAIICPILLSYAALHTLGLGLATAAATLIALAAICYVRRDQLAFAHRPARACLIIAILLLAILLHAAMMTRGDNPAPTDPTVPPPSLKALVAIYGGLIIAALHAGFRSVWAPDAYFWPNGGAVRFDCIYGFATIALASFAVLLMFKRANRTRSPADRARAALFTFALVALLALAAMICLRLRAEPQNPGLAANFLIGARYLLPLNLFCAAGALSLIAVAGRIDRRAVWITCGVIAFAAVASQKIYMQRVMPNLWPRSQVSHDACWQLLLKGVQESQQANLPILDLPDAALADEFAKTMRVFEPLILKELGLPRSQTLRWARPDELSPADLQRYFTSCPSMKSFAAATENQKFLTATSPPNP